MSVEDNSEKQIIKEQIKEEIDANKFSDELSEEHIRKMKELAPQEQYEININGKPTIFKRRKILSGERKQLEILRQKLTRSLQDNTDVYPELEDKLYKLMSTYYLIDVTTGKGMSDKQFELTDFEDMKQILNACAFRTERPIPSPFGKT